MATNSITQKSKFDYAKLDSRTSSILLNVNLNLDSAAIATKYKDSKAKILQAQRDDRIKSYTSLKSTLRESYLTGSLKYGNNFIM